MILHKILRMAQLTSNIYDDAYICNELKTTTDWNNRHFNDLAYMSHSPCVEPAGTPAGGPQNSSTVNNLGMRIDLDSHMRGNYNDDSYYSRDRVNPSLDKFTDSLSTVSQCDVSLAPIHTRIEDRERQSSDRIFKLNTPFTFPWERTLPSSINSQELSRSIYNKNIKC